MLPRPLVVVSGSTLLNSTTEPDESPALSGLRVLDLSRVLAGPLCSMILADLGAEVVKVERPGAGDETRQWGPPWAEGEDGRESTYFLSINRNKRSLAADLNDPTDLALVRELAVTADVLLENFVPGTLERWGLGFESVAAINPRLVHCSITGYGSDGPDARRPGYDFAVQARAGWMSITGEPDGEPVKVGVAVVDILTGQNAAIAILAALSERERSARGQKVEVSLLDSALAGLVNVGQAALGGVPGRRYGNAHATIVPYQAFPTSDTPIVVTVGNDEQWKRFCGVLAAPELVADPRFATNPARVENRMILVPLLEARLRERTAEEWLARLDAAAVPCAPVRTAAEAVRDPAATARDGLWRASGRAYGEIEMIASPLRLRRTPPALRNGPPAIGEHTDEIMSRGWLRVTEDPLS